MKWSVALLLSGGLAFSTAMTIASTAHADPQFKKGGSPAATASRTPGKSFGQPSVTPKGHVFKQPSKGPSLSMKKPPGVVKRAVKAPPVKVVHPKQKLVKVAKHKHRPWRHGLKWRWIVVPSIYLAEELDWCHYHRYRVAGMHFHRSIACHRHARWNHPSIRYVEAY
jgi:hypothetical protein